MSIVLSILQVIGGLLLIVILFVVLTLLVILFCPIRYLIEGEWLEEKWAKAKVHWLLHLFGAKVSYGDNLIYGEYWLFGKKKTFSVDLTKKEEAETFNEDDAEDFVREVEESVVEKHETVNDTPTEKNIEMESAEELRGESIISKIKGIIERIKEVYCKIKKILSDEKNQEAISHIKREIIYLIKILLPKKSKMDAVYSTGSPDTTGQLFGVLACFPAFYHKHWKLLPDFEADDAYFKGSFWGKGRVYGYQIAGIILRILFDKNCKRLYTIINRFIKWMKNDEKSEVK